MFAVAGYHAVVCDAFIFFVFCGCKVCVGGGGGGAQTNNFC